MVLLLMMRLQLLVTSVFDAAFDEATSDDAVFDNLAFAWATFDEVLYSIHRLSLKVFNHQTQ